MIFLVYHLINVRERYVIIPLCASFHRGLRKAGCIRAAWRLQTIQRKCHRSGEQPQAVLPRREYQQAECPLQEFLLLQVPHL